MDYTIQIVTLQPQKLYTMNTTNQPNNIKVGWPVFKRMLGNLEGRKFYGLHQGPYGTTSYLFASTILPNDALDQFTKIDGPTGLYASVQLVGQQRLEHISPALEALIDVYESTIDSTRPYITYYQDDSVDVLVPLKPQQRND